MGLLPVIWGRAQEGPKSSGDRIRILSSVSQSLLLLCCEMMFMRYVMFA